MDIGNKFNRKFKDLEGGLFSEVAKADVGEGAAKLLDQGVDVMAWADPFFPDASISGSVKKVMIEAIKDGFPSHYSMPIGMPALRTEIAKKITRCTGLTIDPSRNVIVTPGSDSGLLYTMMPFIEEGDEVLVPDPSYPSNFLNPKLLGGVTIPVPLYPEDNYQLRREELDKHLSSKTKMLVLCHPNNPTTTVFREENLKMIAEFTIEHDLILISDQAFEDHIYDNIRFISPATLPGMWERTLTVCSISKGIGLSGFRIGYICANDQIMDVLYGGAVYVLGAAATITSVGAIAALQDTKNLETIFKKMEKRRRTAYRILNEVPGVSMTVPESGILAWLDISGLGTSEEVVAYILEHAKILVNGGIHYGEQGKGFIRIVIGCFKDDETAENAFKRIKKALTQLSGEKGISHVGR